MPAYPRVDLDGFDLAVLRGTDNQDVGDLFGGVFARYPGRLRDAGGSPQMWRRVTVLGCSMAPAARVLRVTPIPPCVPRGLATGRGVCRMRSDRRHGVAPETTRPTPSPGHVRGSPEPFCRWYRRAVEAPRPIILRRVVSWAPASLTGPTLAVRKPPIVGGSVIPCFHNGCDGWGRQQRHTR